MQVVVSLHANNCIYLSSYRSCSGEEESKIGVAASTSLLIGLLVSLAEVRILHMPVVALQHSKQPIAAPSACAVLVADYLFQ